MLLAASYGGDARTIVVCNGRSSGGDKQRPSISNTARIRDEVISPFRSFRMFVYPALIASGCIAGLTAVPRLVAALGNAPNAAPLGEVLQGLGIDAAAVALFGFLYRSDSISRDLALARLSREESLAALRVELGNGRIVSLEQMRGSARFVIIAGPETHVEEAMQRSQPFQKDLVERGVTVITFVTTNDGSSAQATAAENQTVQWRARAVYTADWSKWLKEQKRLAKIPEDKPVYLSLRLDGRVRGSGVGFPPWSALVAQLPPLKGIWQGALDGMDGRV